MIRPGETSVTVCTLKGLHSRVFSVMPRELIRAGKLPCAAIPCAFVWLFPWTGRQKRMLKLIKLKITLNLGSLYWAIFI